MTQLDEKFNELEQQMVAPENLDDHVRLNELNQALEQARQTQETKLVDWEELSLELEEYEVEQKESRTIVHSKNESLILMYLVKIRLIFSVLGLVGLLIHEREYVALIRLRH